MLELASKVRRHIPVPVWLRVHKHPIAVKKQSLWPKSEQHLTKSLLHATAISYQRIQCLVSHHVFTLSALTAADDRETGLRLPNVLRE